MNTKRLLTIIIQCIIITTVIAYLSFTMYYNYQLNKLSNVVKETEYSLKFTNYLPEDKQTELVDKISKLGYENVEVISPTEPIKFKDIITLEVNAEPPFSKYTKWAWYKIFERVRIINVIAMNAEYLNN